MPTDSTPDKALAQRNGMGSTAKRVGRRAQVRPTDRYSLTQRRELLGYLERQDRSFKKQRMKCVWQDLDNLFSATGLGITDNEFAAVFREQRQSEPSHKQLAETYRKLRDPKNSLVTKPVVSVVIVEIAAQVRGKWDRNAPASQSALRRLQKWDATEFSPSELEDVRLAAEHLANYHENMSANHTSRRGDLDTLLIELADIFARHTRFEWDRYELGKAERSRFIQFARLALSPFVGDAKEVKSNALYFRWLRLRKESRRPGRGRPKSFRPTPRPNRWKNKRKLTSRI